MEFFMLKGKMPIYQRFAKFKYSIFFSMDNIYNFKLALFRLLNNTDMLIRTFTKEMLLFFIN